MWKAILVLFVTTNSNPMATMIGQFPDQFVSRADCQAFIAVKRGEVNGSVEIVTKRTTENAEILHHELGCVEDTTGMPT